MKKNILLLLFSMVGCATLCAQSAKDLRMARTTALSVYERYILVANSLRNGGDNVYNFKDLFADRTDSVYNDILPLPGAPYLSCDVYCQNYTRSVKQAAFSYSDFSMEQPRLVGNKWIVTCHYKRTLTYRSKDGFQYPSWSFDYTMRIEMNRAAGSDGLCGNPKIASITVSEPVEKYVVIMNPSRIPLSWGGINSLPYDPKCDCWAGDIGDKDVKGLSESISTPFAATTMTSRKPHFYTFYQNTRNVIGGGVYYAPFAIDSKLDGQFAEIKENSNAWRLRGFYGINLTSSSKTAAFLNMGLEFANRNHTLSGTYEIHYDAVDSDNDPYRRNIHANINEENIKIFSFGVPVTVSYLIRVAGSDERPHFFSVDAGLYASFKAITRHTLNMNADYTGTYNYFGQIEFDHYYDYGHYDLNENNVVTDVKEQTNKFDAGVTLGLGFWFSVGKNSFLRADLTALKGLLPEMKYNSNYRITENSTDYHTALQSSNDGAMDFYIGISYIKSL